MNFLVKNTTVILQQLRLLMMMVDVDQNPLTAYIVPSGDAHHVSLSSSLLKKCKNSFPVCIPVVYAILKSLRMADCDQRRAYVTGFDGSSGVAIITQTEALLWTDARYFIQAEEQMDDNWMLMKDGKKAVIQF